MLQDVVHPPELCPAAGISSPIAVEIASLCDENKLFPDALGNSDVSSCSGGADCGATAAGTGDSNTADLCYFDDGFASTFSPFTFANPSSLSALLETEPPPEREPNIASLPVLPYIADQQNQLDQIMLSDAITSGYPSSYCSDAVVPPMQLQSLPSVVYEEECLPQLPLSYAGPDAAASCAFLEPGINSFYAASTGMQLSTDAQGLYSGGSVLARSSSLEVPEYQRAELAAVGVYGPEAVQPVYKSGDIQVITDNHHPPTLPTSEISVLDEATFKVRRLSVEERKEKIHRYMKKRNERNFSKKIKYACRKTLADSRPRVRGRFAKNDESGDATRHTSVHHDYEEDEDVMVKEEEMFDSDIFAHISGVNSFKYNYTIESWI